MWVGHTKEGNSKSLSLLSSDYKITPMFTMSPAHYNYLFILLIVLHKGFSQLVRTQQVVTATLGEDAVLNCELKKSKDGKVEFEDEGLQNCSIIIRGVSRGDESCYKCLFNTFPDGPISGTTCLQVNELYGPSLLITQTNNSHTTLSCSATGRPAPIVTWDDMMIEHSTTVDVTHPNGTITVTTTATVAVASLTDKEVRCVVSLSFSDVTNNASMVIPARDQASFAGQSQVSDDDWISGTVVGSVVGAVMGSVLVSVCLIAVFWVMWLKMRRKETSSRKKNLPDPEISRTPLKTPPPSNFTPTSSPSQMPHSSTSSSTKRRMTKKDTPTSSPSVMQSLSSSAKRVMHQAQEAVKSISIQESDDGVTRNLLEDDDY
ncbi:uncharacterized protein LOC121558986 isoform X5 [Coregonus clupeaformis]|uniref:uncharacterized protein LOC121558986 isoform X5 n=1 Tax=Coregonus clupeaformis TaxID=59861 RepID=UPI001E1C8BAD|nr:uncharacterized protein LOC121558986 isoform X5 [Coregonus clupeaformis]